MKTSDIKLKWQRHNQKNGMSWNEMSEFANEIADHVLSEKRKEANDFIIQIAELLGMDTDGIGYDGLQWGIDDFEEALDNVLSEKIKGFNQWLRSIGSRAWRDDMDKLIDEYLLNNSQVKCECIECGGLFMSDVRQDYCSGCDR